MTDDDQPTATRRALRFARGYRDDNPAEIHAVLAELHADNDPTATAQVLCELGLLAAHLSSARLRDLTRRSN